MSTTQLRISSIADDVHSGKNVTVEVRKDYDSSWIDISNIISDIEINLAVDSLVQAKLTVYPSAVFIEGEAITTLFMDEKLGLTENVRTSPR